MKTLNPELWTRDWVVNHETTYHLLFPFISKILLLMSSAGWGFAIANVLCSALIGWFVFLIVREVTDSASVLPVFLIVMAILTRTVTRGFAGVYITAEIFQPSTIGALGFLAAIYFFVTRQYLISGLCLAVGGINHANYLMLGFPVFGLAHLLLGKDQVIGRLLKQLFIPALAVIPFLPLMLTMANSSDAPLANHVYVDIRLAHHHNPHFFWPTMLPFVGVLLLGLVLGWKRLTNKPAHQQIRALFIAMLVGIGLGLACTTIFFSYSVARFMPWRTSPFVVVLAVVIGISGAVVLLQDVTKNRVVLFMKRNLMPIALGLWVIGGVWPVTSIVKKSSMLRGLPEAETELYAWARTTNIDALFCVPPLLEDFRIQGLRAVIIDWKPAPSLPGEVVEWYHRMEAITGTPNFQTLQQAIDGYNGMTDERVQALRETYGTDYVVIRKDRMRNALTEPVVYENEIYLVVATQRPEESGL